MDTLIVGILGGAAFGFCTALTGILKNRKQNDYEGIDVVKAGTTVIITAIAGGIIGYQNLGLTESALSLVVSNLGAVGLSEWVSNLLKGIFAHLKK